MARAEKRENKRGSSEDCPPPWRLSFCIIAKVNLCIVQIRINHPNYHARLAQSVERWTLNPTVVGSSPTLGECFAGRNFIFQNS